MQQAEELCDSSLALGPGDDFDGTAGTLPASLGTLSGLQTLDASTNRLDGLLPSKPWGGNGRWTNLTILDLSSNEIDGEVTDQAE